MPTRSAWFPHPLLSLLLRKADIRLNPSRRSPGNRHPVK